MTNHAILADVFAGTSGAIIAVLALTGAVWLIWEILSNALARNDRPLTDERQGTSDEPQTIAAVQANLDAWSPAPATASAPPVARQQSSGGAWILVVSAVVAFGGWTSCGSSNSYTPSSPSSGTSSSSSDSYSYSKCADLWDGLSYTAQSGYSSRASFISLCTMPGFKSLSCDLEPWQPDC